MKDTDCQQSSFPPPFPLFFFLFSHVILQEREVQEERKRRVRFHVHERMREGATLLIAFRFYFYVLFYTSFRYIFLLVSFKLGDGHLLLLLSSIFLARQHLQKSTRRR